MEFFRLNQEFETKVLVFWLNTLPVSSCLLVSSLDDLKDGNVFCDLLKYLKQQLSLPPDEDPPTEVLPLKCVVQITFSNICSKMLLIADELLDIIPSHFPCIMDIENGRYHNTLSLLIRDETYCERIAQVILF